jgi:hypothetical protein
MRASFFLLAAAGMVATNVECFTVKLAPAQRLAPARASTCAARRGGSCIVMQSQGGDGGRDENNKWSADVQDEDAERIESGKVAVASALVGSIVAAPLALLIPGEFSA